MSSYVINENTNVISWVRAASDYKNSSSPIYTSLYSPDKDSFQSKFSNDIPSLNDQLNTEWGTLRNRIGGLALGIRNTQ